MKHLIILLLLVTSIASLAQNCTFSGSIVDSEGNAIPFTSVYIASIANGSMANIDGDFSITAPCSIYTIQFQSLGFEKKALKIDFSKNLEQIITLKSIAYDLGEVEVDASQEDIAYSYIRKATAMAEYYKKQITAYECELYIRSFYDPEKIPWLAKKLISEEDLADMATGNISETLL
ncbi:MAG: carboxypeptidase-like regulatory domain-containing protein, partial [Vicingaceae bacterium]